MTEALSHNHWETAHDKSLTIISANTVASPLNYWSNYQGEKEKKITCELSSFDNTGVAKEATEIATLTLNECSYFDRHVAIWSGVGVDTMKGWKVDTAAGVDGWEVMRCGATEGAEA